MSRVRIKYKRTEELRYIGHLDMMRMWHRAFLRAGIPIAYSEGFNPHPKMVFAAPLPLGILSDADFLDVYITEPMASITFKQMLGRQLPKGIELSQIMTVPDNLPPMPAVIKKAEFTVEAEKPDNVNITEKIREILDAESIPWEQIRDKTVKTYDLRPMIYDLSLVNEDDTTITIKMTLKCDAYGSGRPEQVLKLIGIEEINKITRNKLIFEQPINQVEDKEEH